MTRQNRSQRTSGRSASSLLFLLSGEAELPEAEARALVLMLDPSATFSRPEERVLLARTAAEPEAIESRVAFSRRVGRMIDGGALDQAALARLRRGTYAVRVLDPTRRRDEARKLVERLAEEVGGRVSLDDPDAEVTVVRGEIDHFALTFPKRMRQGWSLRRPRARAFFHPSAIFPKLSRFLVNMTRVREGEVFFDPFCGTGSLLIEASEAGALSVGMDLSAKMVRGSLRNRDKLREEWLGVVRGDVRRMPVRTADGIATDIPYGRVSSTAGSNSRDILAELLSRGSELLEPERRLVVMHPNTVGIPERRDFLVEEEHHLYIHSKLTRTISVLRRV